MRPRARDVIGPQDQNYVPVQIPFTFYLNPAMLDPLDDEGFVMGVATGTRPPWEPPHDPFTAWITLAALGDLEEGESPHFPADTDRETRLGYAREILDEKQFFVVETLAVPQRYRQLSVAELVQVIRTAPLYTERAWAACWLELLGWVESPHDTFMASEQTPAGQMDEMYELIAEAFAASIGITRQDGELSWRRVYEGVEMTLVEHRLSVCSGHYYVNGPPPYHLMKNTIPFGPGWRQLVQIVPE